MRIKSEYKLRNVAGETIIVRQGTAQIQVQEIQARHTVKAQVPAHTYTQERKALDKSDQVHPMAPHT